MAPDWAEALAPVDEQIAAMGQFLREEIAAGRAYLPAGDHVLRAFSRPLAEVQGAGRRPGPLPDARATRSGSASRWRPDVGRCRGAWSTSTPSSSTTSAYPPPTSGDLTPWADAGRDAAQPGADRRARRSRPRTAGAGWEAVTDQAIRRCSPRQAAARWRRSCGAATRSRSSPMLAPVPWVESVHPSPLSAHRGFFGSRPFSRVNGMLEEQGGDAGGLAPARDHGIKLSLQ